VSRGGPVWWRSRESRDEAREGSGRLPERLRPEFPDGADRPPDGITRRTVLGLMAAPLALGGLAGCRRPVEEIVPYVDAPEDVTPGVARYFATTLPLGAHAYGVVVESHEGRPTKIEGNPLHPSSRGAASAWMQASILDLYDPDRLKSPVRRAADGAVAGGGEESAAAAGDAGPAAAGAEDSQEAAPGEGGAGGEGAETPEGPPAAGVEAAGSAGRISTAADEAVAAAAAESARWDDFEAWWTEEAAELAAGGGRGLAVLASAHASPTLARLADELRGRFPGSRWVVWEPAGDETIYEGLRRATGRAQRPVYDLSRADVVLALDADLFLTESEAVANAHGFAAGRRPDGVFEPAAAAAGTPEAVRLAAAGTAAGTQDAAEAPGRGAAAAASAGPESAPVGPADEEVIDRDAGAGPPAGPTGADRGEAATTGHRERSLYGGGAAGHRERSAYGGGAAGHRERSAHGGDGGPGGMSRLYVAESVPSITGASADHRIRLTGREIAAFAAAVAAALGAGGAEPGAGGAGPGADGGAVAPEAALPAGAREKARAVAADLRSAGGRALVAAGRRQPPEVHALVHRMNSALGAYGSTVTLHPLPPGAAGAWDGADLAALARAAEGGELRTLVVLGGDPAATGPADVDVRRLLARVPSVVYLGRDESETAQRSTWALPESHPLESWGDARAADGTLSVVQPLIAPLYASRSAIELVGLLVADEHRPGYELVRQTWGPIVGDLGAAWRRVLHDGVYAGSAPVAAAGAGSRAAGGAGAEAAAGPADTAGPGERTAAAAAEPAQPSAPPATPDESPAAAEPPPPGDLELAFLVSPTLHDGRFANNPWLQELPDPLTKLCWGNAALVSPATARRLGLEDGDLVTLSAGGRSVELPAAAQPGQADGTVAVALGHGRRRGLRVAAAGAGVDAYPLRPRAARGYLAGASLAKAGGRADLARTQEHWSLEGRDMVRRASLDAYRRDPEVFHGHAHGPGTVHLWQRPGFEGGHQWGMAIDLAACTGCNACVVACQSENNVPVVGAEQVRRNREMHWLRVDRYYGGVEDEPDFAHQPVPCMHCENAPCEQVCPVAATVHDAEGLNAMVYNRCIGTRYCSNNCPYKVRRFNYFNFTKDTPELVAMAMNPDVTVRSRGVMEKCTYCVQRINEGKARARLAGRRPADGEIRTACQQTCPTSAIVFGDLADPGSAVSRAKGSGRDYVLLAELQNFPRTSYLAQVTNPNPDWPGAATAAGAPGAEAAGGHAAGGHG